MVQRDERDVEGAHEMRETGVEADVEIDQAHQRPGLAQAEASRIERGALAELVRKALRAVEFFIAAQKKEVSARPSGGDAPGQFAVALDRPTPEDLRRKGRDVQPDQR